MEFDPIKNIKCLVCDKIGTRAQIGGKGWRLAPNVPFNYTCSEECDNFIIAEQKKEKEAKKNEKKNK